MPEIQGLEDSAQNSDIDPELDAWEQLEAIVAKGDADAVRTFINNLPPGESSRLITQMSEDEQQELLSILRDEDAAELLGSLPEIQAAQLLSSLPADQAAHIFDEMYSGDQVGLLDQLSEQQSNAILEEMKPEEAENVRFLAKYEYDTAGGLMITELLAFDGKLTVDDVISDLRTNAEKYAEYNVQYIYVLKEDRQLHGVLRLRDLLLARPKHTISRIMIDNPTRVSDSTSLQELQLLFDSRPFFGLPVVDAENRLVGVIRRADVEKASEEEAGRTFLQFAGILGGEELRSLPLKIRCARRLSWLSLNILLNVVAASVIAFYEETLAAVIALAVFLPIVSDMSGCSGNQSVAVSTRELVLGVIKPSDFWYVFRKEFTLGLINGIVLGILLGSVAWVWKGTPTLGLVVGGALAANTLVAVCLGAMIPMILKGFKMDPALASGAILTTLTDMCGFFLVLSLAQLMLPWLVPRV